MPSLAEIVLMGGQQRADSMRRLADIDYNRRAQSSALWTNLGTNLAQLGLNTGLQVREQNAAKVAALQQQKNFETQFNAQQTQWNEGAPLRAANLTAAEQNIEAGKAALAKPQQLNFAYQTAVETGKDGVKRLNPQKLQQALVDMQHPDLLPDALAGMTKWNESADAVDQLKRETLAHAAIDVHNSNYNPIVIESYVRNAVDRGIMPASDAGHFLQAPLAEQKKIIQSILAASKQYGEQFKPMAVGGGTVFTPGTGQFQTPPPPPLKPSDLPNIGSFEDYVLRSAGPNATPKQIEQLRAKWADLARDPTPGPQTATGLPPRTEVQVQSMAKTFGAEPIVRRAGTMGEAMTFLNNMPAHTRNPADHQGLIYAFAKVMDPESVVREGEYATVQKYAQSWLATFGFDAKRIVDGSGGLLTDTAMDNMRKTISQRFEAARTGYDNLVRSYTSRINHLTGKQDGGDYLTDYAGAFPDPPRPPGVPDTAVYDRTTKSWKVGG